MTAPVFEALLSTPQALAVFEAPSVVQALLDVEAARVRALAAEGLLPMAAARTIAGVCKAELFDVPALVAEGRRAGGLAAPLSRQLAATVALFDPAAARHVPQGGAGDDRVDTAMALLTRRVLALIDRDLARLLARLLERGHDVAPLLRCQRRLHETGAPALRLHLDLPAGGMPADALAARMSHALQLALPAEPGASAPDEAMRLHAEVGILGALLARLSADVMPGHRPAETLRTPQRVAALLGLLAQPAGQGQACAQYAETASLYLGVHGALLALAEVLDALPSDPVASASGSDVLSGARLAAWTAQALRQASDAPWASFLPEGPGHRDGDDDEHR